MSRVLNRHRQLKDMETMVAGTELYRMIAGEDEEGI